MALGNVGGTEMLVSGSYISPIKDGATPPLFPFVQEQKNKKKCGSRCITDSNAIRWVPLRSVMQRLPPDRSTFVFLLLNGKEQRRFGPRLRVRFHGVVLVRPRPRPPDPVTDKDTSLPVTSLFLRQTRVLIGDLLYKRRDQPTDICLFIG